MRRTSADSCARKDCAAAFLELPQLVRHTGGMSAPHESPLARLVDQARRALDEVDPQVPSSALPHLRVAAEHLSAAIDAAMAAVILEEGAHDPHRRRARRALRERRRPRLARTRDLGAYTSDAGRVTAKGVERALYDLEQGRHQPAPRRPRGRPQARGTPAVPRPAPLPRDDA